jgi:hypothetical protein
LLLGETLEKNISNAVVAMPDFILQLRDWDVESINTVRCAKEIDPAVGVML